MSFDLRAKNKNVECIHIGAFTWPIMLQSTGMGYIIGCGSGVHPSENIFTPDKNGYSPFDNDKYFVNSQDAKSMAKLGYGFIKVKEYINNYYEEMEDQDEANKMKKYQMPDGRYLYGQETGVKFLRDIKKFCDFAIKSGGFYIG